jgi:hypothetical protein
LWTKAIDLLDEALLLVADDMLYPLFVDEMHYPLFVTQLQERRAKALLARNWPGDVGLPVRAA